MLNPRLLKLILGPILGGVLWYLFSSSLTMPQGVTLAITIWVGVWWMTEVIPIPVTSLLPLILFPIAGILDVKTATQSFTSDIIMLFLGGFFLAIAIEKTQLHRYFAFHIIRKMGHNNNTVLGAFMFVSFFLSMWISNTATAVMMVPVALALSHSHKDINLVKILLGTGYGCSIGGMATLIGTPTNLILTGIVKRLYNIEISFYDWFLFACPISVILLLFTYIYLSKSTICTDSNMYYAPDISENDDSVVHHISPDAQKVAIVFILTAVAWMSRSFVLSPFIPGLTDMGIALLSAVSLFLIRSSSSPSQGLLTWHDASKIPWGILLLFGGGLVIAEAFFTSGLAEKIGDIFYSIQHVSLFVLLFVVILSINFLTEMTSNVATAAMILPVLASLAYALDLHPYTLMIGAVLAASCAFMLPVATPPNAVVYASGFITLNQMVKIGLVINIVSSLLIAVLIYYFMPLILGIDKFSFPSDFLIQ